LDCSFVEVDDNIESFKVTLDRIKEGIAVLLVRNNEAIKINIPLSLPPAESKKETFWILPLPEM
jgi:hypothetical protein